MFFLVLFIFCVKKICIIEFNCWISLDCYKNTKYCGVIHSIHKRISHYFSTQLILEEERNKSNKPHSTSNSQISIFYQEDDKGYKRCDDNDDSPLLCSLHLGLEAFALNCASHFHKHC